MIDKTFPSAAGVVADMQVGTTVIAGGYGVSGSPVEVLHDGGKLALCTMCIGVVR